MFITSVASLHVQTQYFQSKASNIHCVEFRVCKILCRTFMSLPSTFEEPEVDPSSSSSDEDYDPNV